MVAIPQRLPIETILFHYQLYFMVRYCQENFKYYNYSDLITSYGLFCLMLNVLINQFGMS